MRIRAKLGYLALGQVGAALLAAVFLWSPTLVYSYYAWRSPLWNISHAFDQQLAGIVMLVIDMLVTLTAMTWIIFKALAFEVWQEQRMRSVRSSIASSNEAFPQTGDIVPTT